MILIQRPSDANCHSLTLFIPASCGFRALSAVGTLPFCSIMKRARTPVVNVVIHNITVNNYNGPVTINHQAGPPSPGRPGTDYRERNAWVRDLPDDDPATPRVARCGAGLTIQCMSHNGRCPRSDPAMFAPVLRHKNKKAYEDALANLDAACAAKNVDEWTKARDTLAGLAMGKCAPCRASKAKSDRNPDTVSGACCAEWQRLKRDVFNKCVECGAERCIEADHESSYADNAKAYAECLKNGMSVEAAEERFPKEDRKVHKVSDWMFWSHPSNGGVEAMRAEADKCRPLCRMCHSLDDDSTSANCNRSDPAKVKRDNYSTDKRFQDAAHLARYRMEKRDYGNSLKRDVGVCENPNCPSIDGPERDGQCIAGYEQMYDWDHLVEATKGRSLSRICNDGHCLETAMPEIHAELGLPPDFDVEIHEMPPVSERRCRLLCKNCHHTRKEWDVPLEG